MYKGKKILAAILLTAMAGSLVTGCKGREKKDWLYSCDPDNMLGFRGYYYEDGNLCIAFDNDEIRQQQIPSSGLSYVIESKEWRPNYTIYLRLDDDAYSIYPEDVILNVTKDELVISFEMDEDDAEDLIGFSMTAGTYFSFDLESESILLELSGGECIDCFTQEYNQDKKEWGEIEHELYLYPMTDENGEPV